MSTAGGDRKLSTAERIKALQASVKFTLEKNSTLSISPRSKYVSMRFCDRENLHARFVHRLKAVVASVPAANATRFHRAIFDVLKAERYDVRAEWSPGGMDGGPGAPRIDLVILRPIVAAIELDRRTPRKNSLEKLRRFNGLKVIVLREAAVGGITFPDWLDVLIRRSAASVEDDPGWLSLRDAVPILREAAEIVGATIKFPLTQYGQRTLRKLRALWREGHKQEDLIAVCREAVRQRRPGGWLGYWDLSWIWGSGFLPLITKLNGESETAAPRGAPGKIGKTCYEDGRVCWWEGEELVTRHPDGRVERGRP